MSLERLEITPFAVIVGEVLQMRRTGSLTIVRTPPRKVLYWSQGELVLITSESRDDSLGEFLVRRGILTPSSAAQLDTADSTDVVLKFHETGLLDLSSRQTLLREWVNSLFIPLFSLDEGTTAFNDETAIDPDKRVFLQSTAALVLEGIRSITNGLVLRRSLGDLKREIEVARDSRFAIEGVPLTEPERVIASNLTGPQTIEAFLRRFTNDSVTAARVDRYIRRLESGNFGAAKALREGGSELRLDFGPGCRVYFGRDGKTIILLLGGGSKRRQDADISAAIARWQRYQQAKKEK